jgi:hypothetical protein
MASRGDRPDIAFGGFLILLAIVALVGTRTLSVGTAAKMGSGYVPRALAWIILGFGIVIGAMGLFAKHRPIPAILPRPIISVLISLAVFALLLTKGGLVLATLGTMAASTCATKDFKWGESLLFTLIITAITVFLFVYGLGLPLSVWPRW